jgi:hypothetical protein
MSEKYDAFRAMMNEMMGEDRDVPHDQRSEIQRHFSDPDVDKYYIAGLSPHRFSVLCCFAGL